MMSFQLLFLMAPELDRCNYIHVGMYYDWYEYKYRQVCLQMRTIGTHGISNILFEDLVILKTTKMLLIRNASIFRVFSYAGCVDYGLFKT